jgi:two-component system OmpR family response regulator
VTVVVVEDNRPVADLYVDTLSGLGHTARPFYDGESFLGALPTLRAALLILDRNLPGIDGLEVARRVRAVCPDLPILMISATPPPQTSAAAAMLDRVLGKPCTLDQFGDAVRALLGPGQDPARGRA